jgi:hypothetical protein
VNRREFLLFRTEGRTKTAELACERLYMQYRDAQMTPDDRVAEEGGEPPARFDTRSARQLFDELERELAGADLLVVTQTAWLAVDDFARAVNGLAERLRAHGTRIEFK